MIKVNETKLMEMVNNSNLEGIKTYLSNEILMQTKTDKSELQKIKAFKRLAKKTHSKKKDTHPYFAGAFEENGKAAICDGYKAAWINKTLEELGDVIKADSEKHMEINKLFINDYSNYTEVQFDREKFTLQLAEYKTYPASEREHHESRFFEMKIEGSSIWFNIEFIKEMDDIFNLSESKLYASTPKQGMFIESDFGRGLILPISRANR